MSLCLCALDSPRRRPAMRDRHSAIACSPMRGWWVTSYPPAKP